MKAHVMREPGSIDNLQLTAWPDPKPAPGKILIAVKAFGLNRSELMTIQGHSGEAVTYPRVLGIECVGEVLDGGGTDLQPGQKVAAAMGFMGRQYDGGYAEIALIP
jgi:NADPH2:quinone reductase